MRELSAIKSFEELTAEELVPWVMDGLRRTLVHYGCWFREVEYQLGMIKAMEVEAEAGDAAFSIILKRLSKVLGFEMDGDVPKALKNLDKAKLLELMDAVGTNWLANDGVWFQAVEKRFGMDAAKRCNDTCWTRFSPYEALRIKKLLGLEPLPGLAGLKAALGYRLYARINRQTLEDVDEHSFIFRMVDCRVQGARKRKGLPDYPCKSAGLVEYSYFAEAIDPRIRTECVGCPPDAHPDSWWCAWKFTLKA